MDDIVPLILITFLLILVAISIITLVVLYQKKQMQFRHEKEQLNISFSQILLQSKLEIQEQILKDISGEIHDNIGQTLSIAKLSLNTIDCADPAATKERISKSGELLSRAIRDLRNLSKNINADFIKEVGLVSSIENELNVIKQANAFNVNYKLTGTTRYLPDQYELILYRMFQELVNNIIKHSEATQINVSVDSSLNYLKILIEDNGKGFNLNEVDTIENASRGLGIFNLKKRANLIGAEFTIDSIPGTGTSVYIYLPVENVKTA